MSKQTIVREFDSVTDYLAYLNSHSPAPGVHAEHDCRGMSHFFGSDSYAAAERLIETGWAEGAQKVADRRSQFDAFLTAAKAAKASRWDWDVTGQFIDVGRYLTGEPEVFGAEYDDGESNSARVVSIRLNSCVSASVSKESIIARGVTALVAVDLLESCGIRCEVILSQATESSTHVDHNVVVKKPSEPVDVDRLAFWLAHPSAFRRFGFKAMEIEGHSPSGTHVSKMSDYGRRQGTVELDSVKTATGLSDSELKSNVLEIAKRCGLQFSDEQISELCNS